MTPEIAHAARPAVAAVPPPAPDRCPENPSDEVQKRAIARAVWTDLLWLMPRDRTVTVTVRGGTVAVEIGPAEAAPAPSADA